MADPFAAGLVALFRGPRSAPATYVPAVGRLIATRIIKTTTPEDLIIGSRSIEAGATLIQLWRADFQPVGVEPKAGDAIVIGDDQFKVMGEPRLNVEGVSWTCEAAAV